MTNHLDLVKWDNDEADNLNRCYGESGEHVQAVGGMINHIESIGGADSLRGGNASMSMRFAEQIFNNAENDKMDSAPSTDHMEHMSHDVFQLKQGLDADHPEAKILDLVKSNGLDNASTRSLFSIVNRILSDISERKSRELTHGVASLLKNIVQLIHRRFSNQAESLKSQSAIFKAREVKYRTQIHALETLAIGTNEENEVIGTHLQQLKFKTAKLSEKKQIEEKDLERLKKEKVHSDIEISVLKQQLEEVKNMHEWHCSKLVEEANEGKIKSEKRIKELECLLANSMMQVEVLDAFTKSKSQKWKDKELGYKSFIDDLCQSIQEVRAAFGATKQEVQKTKRRYLEEFNYLGTKLKGLVEAAANYHAVLTENRKLYNEVQDLKGNIRVYCRVRPFLPGQNQKHTTIEYIGENGELMVTNPLKQGKDSHRFFKFNKVFVPTTTQEEVFMDTRPLIRSVLDGYNVCIFAYGQTGSGKTHTMSGPSLSLKEDWGVNYRALHDLFQISESRRSSICYEIGVQMVEIYNEQVRDLLSTNGSQKRLGIWNTTQPNGLTVPDASMHPVNSMQDVLELMNVGLQNRAVGSTALNERSSRSHSILTIHVRGMDLETNTILCGCLHLVDLAGSERVEKSEATGDRLREAQHINKSLAALGDVISALALKSQHVPYRNSKLTQVLQSSLGGQAKTLMFVHLNPDVASYSETVSTLKFAERVSGVELGAARSNKEGKDVRELMDQVASLKDTIATRDEEIEQLRHLKTSVNNHGISSLRHGSPSSRRCSVQSPPLSTRMPEGTGFGHKAASGADNMSEHSDKHSDNGSRQSLDEFRIPNLSTVGSILREKDANPGVTEDIELLGIEEADAQERLSDISDGDLSMGTETEGSIGSVVEYTLFPQAAKPSDGTSESPSEATPTKNRTLTEKVPVETRDRPCALPKLFKPPQAPQKLLQSKASHLLLSRSSSKASSSARNTTAGSSSPAKPFKRW